MVRWGVALFVLGACGGRTTLDGALIDGGTHVEASVIDSSGDAAADAQAGVGCVATTTTLITPSNFHTFNDSIAIDATHVYVHNSAGIWRISKSAGPPELIIANAPTGGIGIGERFVVDDFNVTWSSFNLSGTSANILRMPTQGGATTLLKNFTNPALGNLAPAQNGAVYVWGSDLLDLLSLQGTVTSLPAVPTEAAYVEQSDNVLYVAAQGGVFRLDTTFKLFASVPGSTDPNAYVLTSLLGFDAQTVYFLYDNYPVSGGLASMPKAGGTPTVLISGNVSAYSAFVVDGDSLYVVDVVANSIIRMNKDGSGQTVVGLGGTASGEIAFDVAVDDRCVYWTSTFGVYAAPK